MEFKKKTLKNGLTILFEKRDVPVTTVMLATKFGAVYENAEEKGIAHFIEHLCFKGTKTRTPREIAFEVESVGGNLNAFTSEEETAYHVKLPSQHLELAMNVIFDIFFNPIFPEEEIKKEANVICEEIKMYEDDPRNHTIEQIKSCLYKAPFGMFIAGTQENVKSMSREQLMSKHDKYYFPGNSILAVVGNNDFEEVVKLAEKFSNYQNIEDKANIPEIKEFNLEKKESRDNLQQANIAIGFHFPKISEKERYSAEVFSAILGEGMSSKLFTEVREKRGLAYAVKAIQDTGKNYGYFIIYIGTEKAKIDEVIKICVEEFSKMKFISEKELEDGKKQVSGNYDVESEDSSNAAISLILEEIGGDAENHYKFKEEIKKVSLEDIKALASKTEYSYFVLSP